MPILSGARLGRMASAIVLAALGAAQPLATQAALPDAINSMRMRGCGGRPPSHLALKTARALDEAARRVANGSDLHAALIASGYSAEQTASIHIATPGGELAAARLLEQHFCAQISEPMLREIGIARHGGDTWIVLAAPLETPRPTDAAAVSRRVLELVNQARAQPRRCGRRAFNATSPLKLSGELANAAHAHSLDMATREYFDHQGPDGSTPASRITRAGYPWQVVGENIAAGVATPDEAVDGWLQSPGHCENLMDPRFTDMGVAYVINPKNPSVIVWTQVFAAPRTGQEPRTTR
jgi:uncharacterized protein YkwD